MEPTSFKYDKTESCRNGYAEIESLYLRNKRFDLQMGAQSE